MEGTVDKAGAAPERRHDIDWLRVLAVALLVPFHTGVIFKPDGISYIKGQPNVVLDYFAGFVHQWHMPLFFLVSGAATWFSLGTKTGYQYIGERIKRLVIPLIFGTLTIVPIQVYCMRLSRYEYQGSYIRFYPLFFNGIAPQGNLEWGHLWFLAYLFVFSVVALPLFLFLRGETGRNLVSRLAIFCDRKGAIFLLALPLALVQASLRAKWPGFQNLIDDWANFFFYITFFIYGYMLCSDVRFRKAVDRHGMAALCLGMTAILTIFGLHLTGNAPPDGYSIGYALFMVLHGFNSWFWIVAILHFGGIYLNFTNRALEYGTEAALPFYILHMAAVVAIGYYALQWNMGVMATFLFICATAMIVVLLSYDLFVRRINVARFLFGMKPVRRCTGSA